MVKATSSNGLFSYRTPKDLFAKVQRDFAAFCDDPNDDKLLNLLFPLCHLREWIWPAGHDAYKGSSPDALSPDARLHHELHENLSYDRIRKLCNNAKHYNDRIGEPTTVLIGFAMGVNGCGDTLGNVNHMVGREPLRDAAEEVYGIYLQYFREHS